MRKMAFCRYGLCQEAPGEPGKNRRKNSISQIITLLAVVLMLSLTPPAHGGIYENSFGLTNGLYAAEGFGSNYYFGLRYNHFFNKWHYIVETSIGFSSLDSPVLQDLGAFQVFDNQGLFTYEFLLGYDFKPAGSIPYVVAGVAGLNQGGQSKFAFVIGLGKHIPLAQYFKIKRFGIRYDIRDQIFKQQITDMNSFISHNLVVSLGAQYYF